MINLLIYILVVCLVAGVVFWIIGLFNFPQPYAKIAQAVLALVVVLVLIGAIFGGATVPLLGVR